MSPVRGPVPLLAVLLLAAACDEESPTGVTPAAPEAPAELTLLLPSVTRESYVAFDTAATTLPGMGSEPALVSEREQPPEDEMPTNPVSAIYDARTLVGFSPGYGWAWGDHEYQGNRGRIETTATVRSLGTAIGSQRAVTEKTFPFIIDFGSVKYISAFAKVYTDIECELTVDGGSLHLAGWQAVVGSPVSNFGETTVSSQSDVARQPPCAPPPTEPTGGGGGGGVSGDPNAVCWYWTEYYIDTGEVFNQQLLYCTDGG